MAKLDKRLGLVRIEASKCDGCGRCVLYCPVRAILQDPNGACMIDLEECVECGVCRRSSGCPKDCIQPTPCPWPRSLRPLFSDPLVEHRDTRVPGRGTEEMKTNEVTGRFLPGEIGLMIEVGRPGVGARLRDVEHMTTALAAMGIEVHPCNPVRKLIIDAATGRLMPAVLEEKVLSAIVECVIPEERMHAVLNAIEHVARDLPTVCTIGLIRCFSNGTSSSPGENPETWVRSQNLAVAPNVKTNLAMGRAGGRG